jgi:hypothetical protein
LVAGDRRADLNSVAMILIAFDVRLELFKKNVKSIQQRKQYLADYVRDERNLKQIRMIVAHTILEEEPLFDLREISQALGSLWEEYTSLLQLMQEEND